MLNFEITPFAPELKRVLTNEGFTSPTPTQSQSWPILLQSKDVISIARTGSGKTCAFLLPALQRILTDKKNNLRYHHHHYRHHYYYNHHH